MMSWRWNSGTPKKDYSGYSADETAYYHKELNTMRDFFRNRPEYAMKFMKEYLGLSSETAFLTVKADKGGTVKLNGSILSLSDGKWAGSLKKGDLNSDGSVSVADMLLLQKHIPGNQSFDEEIWNRADMDGDSCVDSLDMVLLRKKVIAGR